MSDVINDFAPLQLIKAWKTVAGPVFQKQAEFRGLREEGNKVFLLLQVKDPIWRQEIQFNASRLLDALGRELKNLGWSTEKIPTEISFQAPGFSLPLNSRNSKFRRNKEGI